MNEVVKTEKAVVTAKKRPFKKVLAVICSASMATSMVAVNAFAADGSSNIYTTIADSFKTGIQDCVDGIVSVASACIPIAIGIIGMYCAIGAGKKLFMKLTG